MNLSKVSHLPLAAFLAALIMLGMPALARLHPKPADDPWLKLRPPLHPVAGTLLFDGKPEASARGFDALVQARPEMEPHLWQRGLALYYANRFADGRRQFELHRTVNPADVENVTWHFACMAREAGPEAARQAILPVGDDGRVPMTEVLAFYRGSGPADAVIAAADSAPEATRRDARCYAHLYLGLHAEALGQADRAREHLVLAAGRFSMDHFMGAIARLHARLRGWDVPNDR